MDKKMNEMYRDIAIIINYKSKNKNNKEMIKNMQEEFLRKYSYYYSRPEIRNKLIFYKKSNLNDPKKNRIKKEEINLNRFNKIIKIYYSDMTKFEKLDKISRLFPTEMDLWKEYFDLIIPMLDTKFISDLNKVFVFLKKNKVDVEFIHYYTNIAKMDAVYDYSKFVLELYLKESISYNLEDFLHEIGIDKKTFIYCIDTMNELDLDFYKKFIEIKKKNDEIELEYKKKVVEDLVNAIKTGYYYDGCEFNIVEFFKRIPFKYSRNFSKDLLNFIKINMPDYYDIVEEFLKKKRYIKKDTTKEIDYDSLLDSENIIIRGNLISREDKIKVLTYMQDNKLPMFYIVFYEILSKYMKNELELTKISKIKKRIILIP